MFLCFVQRLSQGWICTHTHTHRWTPTWDSSSLLQIDCVLARMMDGRGIHTLVCLAIAAGHHICPSSFCTWWSTFTVFLIVLQITELIKVRKLRSIVPLQKNISSVLNQSTSVQWLLGTMIQAEHRHGRRRCKLHQTADQTGLRRDHLHWSPYICQTQTVSSRHTQPWSNISHLAAMWCSTLQRQYLGRRSGPSWKTR